MRLPTADQGARLGMVSAGGEAPAGWWTTPEQAAALVHELAVDEILDATVDTGRGAPRRP
ncbi:hypothetical protein [Streptomyces sp. or20]|uniref:hypothetical protein n=1 Tax=Streptomyces sp. or20 TaxID=1828016 RepID=UPI000BEF808A|nr:hypothetical protein [Streptomyces sp. or20]